MSVVAYSTEDRWCCWCRSGLWWGTVFGSAGLLIRCVSADQPRAAVTYLQPCAPITAILTRSQKVKVWQQPEWRADARVPVCPRRPSLPTLPYRFISTASADQKCGMFPRLCVPPPLAEGDPAEESSLAREMKWDEEVEDSRARVSIANSNSTEMLCVRSDGGDSTGKHTSFVGRPSSGPLSTSTPRGCTHCLRLFLYYLTVPTRTSTAHGNTQTADRKASSSVPPFRSR